MKKIKSSLFIKIGLFMLPFLLALPILILSLTYNITYDNNLEKSKETLRDAADASIPYFESFNMYESGEKLEQDGSLSKLCEMFNITYLYALSLDVDANSETYLAIGFGENANNDAKKTRYRGVSVTGSLTEEEIAAYYGNNSGIILHEKNKFDDSLVCYMPCTRYFDVESEKYINYDKPFVIGSEISLNTVNMKFRDRFYRLTAMTITMTILMLLLFAVILYFKVTRPINKISSRMNSFINDRKTGFEKLPVKGSDELAQMADSFNTMADEIDRYIEDIDELNREKHMQEAELNIARKIQRGLLQPESLCGGSFDISAYMLPAKDVGGDLYDYRILNDGRVFVSVADVSGKGISAALFMSRAITLIHQFMLREISPAKILSMFNNELASRNSGGLFITAFLAVWDPMSGVLTYSNAGHNIPYILSGKLTALEGAHGVAAGLFEGETYEDATIKLNAGDILFLYTDGVNEAKNTRGEFYGTQRLEEKLNASSADPSGALGIILKDLNGFTEGAEQSDDITMLTLRINPKPNVIDLKLKAELPELNRIKEEIRGLDVGEDMIKKLMLAAEEIFVNICSYAYDSSGEVELKIAAEDVGVSLTFIDSGKPFDPTADLLDIDEYDHENAIGGLGRFLTFSIAERYAYEYRDGRNNLYLYFCEVNPDDNNENP